LEPLTHFLTGACISRAAGLNRKTLLATTTCVLAAEAADLDVLWYFKSPIDGFAHHRGFTHTFVGAPLVAAFVVGFMYLVWLWKRRRGPEPAGAAKGPALPKTPRWGLLYGFALIAAFSHILLDFTNNYGVRPFEPFSYRWYSWDIVFIFEPLLYAFFLAGLAMPALFGMINEEIGARRKRPRGQGGAIVALVLMLALWGLRDYQHRRAVAALDARLYHGADPIRTSAYPYFINPFKWYGVVETEKFYERVTVDSLTPEVDPAARSETRYKPEETPVREAARDTRLGRVYLDWAQYPMLETEAVSAPVPGYDGPARGGYLVRFYDLRFEYPDMGRRGGHTLGARVLLDQNLHEAAEWFGSRSQRPDLIAPPRENGSK
jgi:inner membrane protein